jgi:hypothetical protein
VRFGVGVRMRVQASKEGGSGACVGDHPCVGMPRMLLVCSCGWEWATGWVFPTRVRPKVLMKALALCFPEIFVTGPAPTRRSKRARCQ